MHTTCYDYVSFITESLITQHEVFASWNIIASYVYVDLNMKGCKGRNGESKHCEFVYQFAFKSAEACFHTKIKCLMLVCVSYPVENRTHFVFVKMLNNLQFFFVKLKYFLREIAIPTRNWQNSYRWKGETSCWPSFPSCAPKVVVLIYLI